MSCRRVDFDEDHHSSTPREDSSWSVRRWTSVSLSDIVHLTIRSSFQPIRIFSPPQPSALSAPSSSTSSPDSEATYRSPTLKAAPTSSSHQSYQTPSSSCQLHISTVDKDRPALPSLESFGSADMSVDSSSDDREDTGLVVEEEIGTAAEESSTEINKRVTVPSKLAAQLVCAILGAVLFEKGQIPTYVTSHHA